MTANQSEWLFDILINRGFEDCVQAFKYNIATLGRDRDLTCRVNEEVAKLDITTVNREEYVASRIAVCERIMREMRTLASDDVKRDRCYIGNVIWNYVLVEAVREALGRREANIKPQKYGDGLVSLFRGHVELIDKLIGLSDDEIAGKIRKWATQKDEFGKLMIENPKNNLRSAYARELKANSIIQGSVNRFKRKL